MEDLFNFTTFLNSLKRLWWVPLLTLMAGVLISVDLCRRLPKIYQASTLIFVEPQKIPANYVRPIVATPIDDRMRTIRQEISESGRIEAMILELNLFADLRGQVPMEELVARVGRGMRLEPRGGRTFKIFYEDQDPQLAATLANAIAQLFIDENADKRRAEAQSTTAFLEEQLQTTKRELEQQEALLTEFNRTHLSELPAQRDVNFQMLQGQRSRLQTTMDLISKEQDRKITLEDQLAELPVQGVTDIRTVAAELDQKRQRLVGLRSQFTEQHPEVALLKRQIAQLEEQASKQAEEANQRMPAPVAMSVREQQLRAQILEVDLRIKDLTRETDRLKGLIGDYERRLANAPRNEQTLLTLRRDYDILQQSYLELLRNKTQAEMAESLELERQGEQFIILDKAVPPSQPYKPNLLQIVAFGCAIALMAGIVLAFLLDISRPRFRSEEELSSAYGIPVLVSIPRIATLQPPSRLTRSRGFLVGTGILAALLVAVALLGLLGG